MDPNSRGPEEYGHDDGGTSRSSAFESAGGSSSRQRPPRDPLTPDFGQHTPALARTVQLVTGDYLLTVNPVDGSEIEACPPGERPGRPEKYTAAERAEVDRTAGPPVPPGPAQPSLPLLARQEERERLVRLLARGRSVRLTGPAGSGRTSLLDLVAEDCEDLAPDGVVRLSGFHRTANDLLHDLFYAVYNAPLHRPEQDELLALVRDIGAVVVLDDVEFGGAGLDELLDATPECAFVIGTTPDVPAPSADSALEEVFLGGLDRAGGVELIERAVGRVLTEEEANWAGDLWFESEGLPLRFVQAGALLRQRDEQRSRADAVDEFGVFQDAIPADAPFDTRLDAPLDSEDGAGVPLPSLGEAAAPAPLLASRLSESGRATLRFAVALGGEVPHRAHLPALVGDTHADAALGELASCGLVSPVGSRYRLAAGVLTQLVAAGYVDDADARALSAAQHYAWWAGHPSVTPERVCAEADALLAALGVLVPGTTAPAEGEESVTVQLARTAAPAFAAGLHWSAWERTLRFGAEASRLADEVSNRPTSTTSWASWRSAADSSTGPAPSWRPPSACAAHSPTSVAPWRAAAPWLWSPTAPARRRGWARRRARRSRTRATRSRSRRPGESPPRFRACRRPVKPRRWSSTEACPVRRPSPTGPASGAWPGATSSRSARVRCSQPCSARS